MTKNSDTLYHDTLMLLNSYRDVVWSMELSIQHVKSQYRVEYNSSIDDFLESAQLAGINFGDEEVESHAKCIERSNRMLKLMESAVELLRSKHKYGETYYWILYYTYLSPQKLENSNIIISHLEKHMNDISYRSYFRKKKEAINALGSILWGFTAKDTLDILDKFFDDK